MLLPVTYLAFSVLTEMTSPSVVRARPYAAADSLPVLTVDALTRMTTLMEALMKKPDSLQVWFARTDTTVLVSEDGRDTTDIEAKANFPVAAVKHPSFAADLQRAGLTAAQFQSYLDAFLEATGPLLPSSIRTVSPVREKNLAFLKAHSKERDALIRAGQFTSSTRTEPIP